MDFTCPRLSSFFVQKMENVLVFGKTHLVTLDILQEIFVTLSNCLLPNKGKTYNAMVLGHDVILRKTLEGCVKFVLLWVRSVHLKYFKCKFWYFFGKCPIFDKFWCANERSTLPRGRGSLRAR